MNQRSVRTAKPRIEALTRELSSRASLLRTDFGDFAKTTLKTLIKAPPRQRPKLEVLARIDKVVSEAITTTDGLEALLADLSYLQGDLKRCERWLKRMIDFGMMAQAQALKKYPKLKPLIIKFCQLKEQENAAFDASLRAAARRSPGPIKLSTRTLTKWPKPDALKRNFQANAVIYAVFNMGRDIFFEKRRGYDYGRIADSGNSVEIFWTQAGVVIVGFDHDCGELAGESGVERPHMQKGFPREFNSLRKLVFRDGDEPKDISFCAWYLNSKNKWERAGYRYPNKNPNADGSQLLWFYVAESPKLAVKRLGYYLGQDFEIELIQELYEHKPLTSSMLKKLNPKTKVKLNALKTLGYPIALGSRKA